MPALPEVDDPDAALYAPTGLTGGAGLPFDVPASVVDAAATRTALVLVAVRGDEEVAETRLMLTVRLAVDDAVHLWSDRRGGLTASVVLAPRDHRLRINLAFAAAARPATEAAADAAFLQAAADAGAIAIRLPDGSLAPDRIAVPAEAGVEPALLRLLNLLADVSLLSRTELTVPAETDEELVKDLLTARRLLNGQEVRGRWRTGEIVLGPGGLDAVREALAAGDAHELVTVSESHLDYMDVRVPLGEVRQVYANAEVEEVVERPGEVVLRVRARGGSAETVMTPAAPRAEPVEPDVVLPGRVFDELAHDLAEPPRRSRLRDLL